MKHNISLATSVASVASASLIAFATVACGSSDSGGGTTSDKSPTTPSKSASSSSSSSGNASNTGSSSGASSDSTSSTTADKCVKPGDKGNEKGIGAYCTTTDECKTGLLCTKDFGAGPDEPWFCTATCDNDATCGSDSMCYAETRGKGCLPNACKPQ